jgi:hypothetical protein
MGDLMVKAWKYAQPIPSSYTPEITYLTDKPTGVFHRVGNPTRMNEHYKAKVSLEEGIKRALAQS